jgi:hypothetical protein
MKSRNILTRFFEISSVWLSAIISSDEFTVSASAHPLLLQPRNIDSASWNETQSSESGAVDCRLALYGEIYISGHGYSFRSCEVVVEKARFGLRALPSNSGRSNLSELSSGGFEERLTTVTWFHKRSGMASA